MKTNYTDTELQAAIDEACLEVHREYRGKVGSNLVIDTDAMPSAYKAEGGARLDLIKSALAALPEPEPPTVDGKTPGQVACEAWNNGDVWKETNYKQEWERSASAVLAAFGNQPQPAENPDLFAELKAAHADGKMIQINCCTVEHPNWIDLPSPAFFGKLHEYRIKPETFEAHGKTWTRHNKGDVIPCAGDAIVELIEEKELTGEYAQYVDRADTFFWLPVVGWRYADEPTPEPLEPEPWVPKVGDVVTLKSGGPKMTVGKVSDETEVFCFRGDDLMKTAIPTACLQPA